MFYYMHKNLLISKMYILYRLRSINPINVYLFYFNSIIDVNVYCIISLNLLLLKMNNWINKDLFKKLMYIFSTYKSIHSQNV